MSICTKHYKKIHESSSTYWFKLKQTPLEEGKVVNCGKGNTSDKSSSEKDNEESKLKVTIVKNIGKITSLVKSDYQGIQI